MKPQYQGCDTNPSFRLVTSELADIKKMNFPDQSETQLLTLLWQLFSPHLTKNFTKTSEKTIH